MTKLRCPVCNRENSASLGRKHKVSFKCQSCGTEVLVERHNSEDAQHHRSRGERYRLHPKRA
jgi:transposase-like protein